MASVGDGPVPVKRPVRAFGEQPDQTAGTKPRFPPVPAPALFEMAGGIRDAVENPKDVRPEDNGCCRACAEEKLEGDEADSPVVI